MCLTLFKSLHYAAIVKKQGRVPLGGCGLCDCEDEGMPLSSLTTPPCRECIPPPIHTHSRCLSFLLPLSLSLYVIRTLTRPMLSAEPMG